MSNQDAAQLSGGVVIGVSSLSYKFAHPALVWIEHGAPDLLGHHYDPETRRFYAPDENGDATETVVYTAPEQP